MLAVISSCSPSGMEEVGIYRLSGIASEVKSLKSAFDESESTSIYVVNILMIRMNCSSRFRNCFCP